VTPATDGLGLVKAGHRLQTTGVHNTRQQRVPWLVRDKDGMAHCMGSSIGPSSYRSTNWARAARAKRNKWDDDSSAPPRTNSPCRPSRHVRSIIRRLTAYRSTDSLAVHNGDGTGKLLTAGRWTSQKARSWLSRICLSSLSRFLSTLNTTPTHVHAHDAFRHCSITLLMFIVVPNYVVNSYDCHHLVLTL